MKIPKNKTWNLSVFFKDEDDADIEKDISEAEKRHLDFAEKWKDRKDYLEDPEAMKEALDEYEYLEENYGLSGKAGYYFMLRSSQDQDNKKIKAKAAKIHERSVKIANEMQFFTMRISKIPEGSQKIFLEHPGLKPYKHFLEILFSQARYLLSEDEEKIINIKSSTSYSNWVKMMTRLLSKQEREIFTGKKKEKKTFSEIISMLDNLEKKVRDSAASAFNSILEEFSDIAESELNSVLEDKKNEDMLRGFDRPDKSRHVSDDIDTDVVDALIKAVSSRFDIPKRHYKIKASLLGVEKLEYHERNIPLGDVAEKYTYEKSVGIVASSLEKLDIEFLDIFRMLVEGGNYDVLPRKGKSGGAFCASTLKSLPTYVLLNHTEKIDDVLTLAHETGHAINNEMMKKKVNAINYETSLATAEVASTFMEDFSLKEIKFKDDEMLSVMVRKMDQDVSTIFRQVACYMFEQELHKEFREKGYLSKQEIGNLFQKHMSLYMGPAIKQSAGSENWWIYWGHIRNYFYNYSYASGLLISKAMQKLVREDPKFIEKVKFFLSAGTEYSPKETFEKIGIDISKKEFWEKGLEQIEEDLREIEKYGNQKNIQDKDENNRSSISHGRDKARDKAGLL